MTFLCKGFSPVPIQRKKQLFPERAELYKFICANIDFDYISKENPEYPMLLRVVRFKISEDAYENIITNLPEDDQLTDKLERLDRCIKELATKPEYQEKVQHMSCFLGIKTQTALSTLVEVGYFKRFASAQQFASYLGLTPGEDSSGGDQNRLGSPRQETAISAHCW